MERQNEKQHNMRITLTSRLLTYVKKMDFKV